MFRILKHLYDSKFWHLLWFKWGTALYFFYNLDRFSVDLDFNLTKVVSSSEIENLKQELLEYLQNAISDMTFKIDGTLKNSIRYIAQYGGEKKIKIEISSKLYDDVYEIKNLSGIDVQVMKIDYMFAHKFCAFFSRYQQRDKIANRDLFDIDFLLSKGYRANEKIIQQRSKIMFDKVMKQTAFIDYLISFLTKHQTSIQKNILDWLWELVDENKKNDIKKNLLKNLSNKLDFYRMGL